MTEPADSTNVTAMTYLETTNVGDFDIYQQVRSGLDRHSHGLIARYAGRNEHGLAVTSIWQTKADCDRFTTEHLIPTLRAVIGDITSPPGTIERTISFEALDELHPGTPS